MVLVSSFIHLFSVRRKVYDKYKNKVKTKEKKTRAVNYAIS